MALLERLWHAFHDNVRGAKRPFERISTEWLKLGFQNADPASDIRGGGVLAVENMVAFVERSPDLAIAMAEAGEDGDVDVEHASYMPWAPAGVAVTRLLLEVFGAVAPVTGAPVAVHDLRKPFWPLALEFDALYALAFELLDATFDDEHGTYMSFPHVKATVRDKLERALVRHRAARVDALPGLLKFEYHAKRLPAAELARARAARREAMRKSALAVRAAVRLGAPTRHPSILREGWGQSANGGTAPAASGNGAATSPLHGADTGLAGKLFRRVTRTSTADGLDAASLADLRTLAAASE